MKEIKIGIMGAGYVGLAQACCLSYLARWDGYETILDPYGYRVTEVKLYDIVPDKIQSVKDGNCPIYEPNMDDYIRNGVKSGTLLPVGNVSDLVNCDIVYLCVGTPSADDGTVNLSYLRNSVKQLIEECAKSGNVALKAIIVKSTVPPGTAKMVRSLINNISLFANSQDVQNIEVISNPEFLREGYALYDLLNPDKVVIGVNQKSPKTEAQNILIELNRCIADRSDKNSCSIIVVSNESAEMIKYANNAMLAMKISFVNEISWLCKGTGADVTEVLSAVGKDSRISPLFMSPGPGYGGSCFPKDTLGLKSIAQQVESELGISELVLVNSINKANETHIKNLASYISDIEYAARETTPNPKILFMGISFKPNSDDARQSQTLKVFKHLKISKDSTKDSSEIQSQVFVHDYKASCDIGLIGNATRVSDADLYTTLVESRAVIIMTDWGDYKSMILNALRNKDCQIKYILDTRFILNKDEVPSNVTLLHIGK